MIRPTVKALSALDSSGSPSIARADDPVLGKSSSTEAAGAPRRVPLSELPTGSEATLSGSFLPDDDLKLLAAMGLSDHSPVRICRQGEPCIVQVRSTRVGIARAIAERLLAEPVFSGSPKDDSASLAVPGLGRVRRTA